jgi:hypothetical protein
MRFPQKYTHGDLGVWVLCYLVQYWACRHVGVSALDVLELEGGAESKPLCRNQGLVCGSPLGEV